MNNANHPDLSACRHWRPSAPLGHVRVGIIPEWNAVSLLNPAAALIWDLLIETGDADATAKAYADRVPERAEQANDDIGACLAAWAQQGFFQPPEPSEEDLQVRALADIPPPPATTPLAFTRTIELAGIAMRLEITDPALCVVVSDLLVDFPDTEHEPHHVLHSSKTDDGWVLYIDGHPVRVSSNLPLARGQIVAELVRLAGGDAGWRATVHGAVLTGASGPVLLVGESGAGKSTLSAGLVARGWRIIAEDLAAFGEGWAVCPMPFALSIKEGAVDTLAPDFPELAKARVHQLGPRRVRYQGLPIDARAVRAERPRVIVEVHYTATMGQAPATFERLSEIEALGLFLNEESYIGFDRNDTDDFLDMVARTPAYRIRYGTIAAAEQGIRAHLERHMPEDRA